MHQFATLLRSAAGCADDMQDRYIFRIAARDTVNSAKLSHTKGGEQRSSARHARITVRGISGVQLIGASHPTQGRVVNHMVKKLQIIIARHAKRWLMPHPASLSSK